MGEVAPELKASTTEAVPVAEAVPLDEQLPIHVLVVDDCFLDRRIVAKLLHKASFQVTTVDSGKKAMEVLGIHTDHPHNHSTTAADATQTLDNNSTSKLHTVEKIDLILTDFCMPEMNGHDLLVAVKGHSEKTSTPVVIMSSEYNQQRITSCLESGAEEFLQKPLKLKDLEKLRAYVRTETATVTRSGTKRKATAAAAIESELTPSSENKSSEKLPRMTGVTVA
ncbi:Two-component response regulator ARR8 [Linum perenne]